MNLIYRLAVGLFFILPMVTPVTAEESLQFLSTQLNPPEEADKMRHEILNGFPALVDYVPYDDKAVFQRLARQNSESSEGLSLLGGLHGDFVDLYNAAILEDLSSLLPRLKNRKLLENFLALGRMQGDGQYYIPWMQATYIMVANRKALKYLPDGADVNSLSYDQFASWATTIKQRTGKPMVGFPIGNKGLMHRFFQGYLYPSFTNGMVGKYKSRDAVKMWRWFHDFWPNVNLQSLTFNNMSEPLLSEEVWIGWDHTARVLKAITTRPNDFIAFPAPAGPKGRGFLVILAGLGIPRNAPNEQGAADLIDYLTQPDVQIVTVSNVGFFPVLSNLDTTHLPAGLNITSKAVSAQAAASDALPGVLPIGLGEKEGEFNSRYLLTFSRIILRGMEIETVLATQGAALSRLISDTNASCWPPDTYSAGPCPVN